MTLYESHHCTVEEMDDGSLYCEECGATYPPEADDPHGTEPEEST